ncbi:MAG: LysR family transcriptional regulator [Comamonadaceae bacterium]|nr:MAG: LysR family transcriptional regulator [Comamonadaceae bacterium]
MRTSSQHPLYEEMALFVRVVETGSFSDVARQMGATPSAVSRSIARLERALGTRLLQRTTRKLGLTPSGTEILQHCTDIVSAARAVMDIGGQHREAPHGLVRVCVPKAIGQTVIHPHIKDFLIAYPSVDVQLILDDRALDLVDHNIDLAVRVTETPPVGLIGRQLMSIEHMICASPDYLAQHQPPTTPMDLSAHSCICLGETPSDARWKFVKDGKSISVEVRGRYTANNTGVRLDAVCDGFGIGSLPEFTARKDLEQGRIVQLLPEWRFVTHYTGALWLLYTPTRYVPAKLRVLIDHLSDHFQRPNRAAAEV